MSTVTTSWRGTIAVVLLDNAPVNMGNASMRADLARVLRDLAADPQSEGVVIASALTHFYAGSDISEFAGELQEPQLPSVIAAIETAAGARGRGHDRARFGRRSRVRAGLRPCESEIPPSWSDFPR